MQPEQDFIEKALETIKKKKADCISFGFYSGGSRFVQKCHRVLAYYFFIMTKIGFPHAIGGAILVKKDVHHDRGGFDETIRVLEDFEYAKRISKKYKYSFVLKPSIGVSIRRIEKDGLWRLTWKYFQMEFHRIFFGEIRKDKFKYFD